MLLAVIGLALLIPASAPASAISLPAETSSGEVDAAQVDSYQDAFDVSEQTAEEHLEIQQDGAAVVERLESSQGKNYAGVWFDNENGEFVVPTVAAADRASIAVVLDGADLQADFRTAPVESSWGQLEAAQARIDKLLRPLFEAGLVETSLDPRANAVVVTLAGGSSRSQRATVEEAVGAEGAMARLSESQEPTLAVAPQGCTTPAAICDAPMRGGVAIVPTGGSRGPSGCTAGFKGIGDAYGNRFMITAGHCFTGSGGVYNWDSFTLTPEARKPLGHIDAYSFPGHDYAAINVNGSYWDKPSWPRLVTYWGVNQEYPISYESSSYLGEYVCHAGQQSGLSCGSVNGLHMTETYEDDKGRVEGSVGNLTRVEHICSVEGDSGGPVFAPGNVALGIYVASDKGRNEPACYHTGYYTEITEDTDLLGVHVAPRIPPPPPPPSWHQDNLGGAITAEAAISTWGPGNLNVFARGSGDAIFRKPWSGTSWGEWVGNWGCCIVGGPSAVSWGSNRIDVVARVSGDSVGHWYSVDGGANWSYDNLGGSIASDPDIATLGANRLVVYARGKADNAIYHRDWNGSGWSPWQSSGCCIIGSPGVVSGGYNRIDVVARVSGNSIGHWYSPDAAASWYYDNLGGTLIGDPDIASWGPNRLDVFATGTNNGLWHKWWNGGWSEWESMGGAITGGPGAVSWGNNRIDVVARRTSDNTVEHWWWE